MTGRARFVLGHAAGHSRPRQFGAQAGRPLTSARLRPGRAPGRAALAILAGQVPGSSSSIPQAGAERTYRRPLLNRAGYDPTRRELPQLARRRHRAAGALRPGARQRSTRVGAHPSASADRVTRATAPLRDGRAGSPRTATRSLSLRACVDDDPRKRDRRPHLHPPDSGCASPCPRLRHAKRRPGRQHRGRADRRNFPAGAPPGLGASIGRVSSDRRQSNLVYSGARRPTINGMDAAYATAR